MVEQETQTGQQYYASQQYMEPINHLCSLNLPEINNLSSIDAMKSQSASSSQVLVETNCNNSDSKQQNTFFEASYNIPDYNVTDDVFTGFSDLNDFSVDTSLAKYDYSSTSPFSWNSQVDAPNFKLDDVFQVDEADLFHGPTLAELNANDESLFDSFDSLESYLPSENKMSSFQFQPINTAELASESNIVKSELKEKNSNNSNIFFLTKENEKHIKSDSEVPDMSLAYSLTIPCSFNSEETKNVKQFTIKQDNSSLSQHVQISNLDDKSLVEMKKCDAQDKDMSVKKYQPKDKLEYSSITSQNFFHETSTCNDIQSEKEDSNDEEEEEEYSSSDSDSDISHHASRKRSSNSNSSSTKKIRYFWQYNIKTKGPNNSFTQSPSHAPDVCSSINFRRGDGTDLTPNPQKLYNIGVELEKLNSVINNLVPVSKLPAGAKMKSRKEKNKLASRACRLKKKAYHEANKLKNFGLQQEYELLQHIINESRKILVAKVQNIESSVSCQKELSLLLSKDTKKVAGCTTEYVNTILNNVKEGNSSGGLNDI